MPWGHDDTARLLCAWAEARAPFSRVFQRFEELSVGGKSGRRESSLQHRLNCMVNAHKVVAAFNNKIYSENEASHWNEGYGEDHPTAESPWFKLTSAERRSVYMSTTPTEYHYMDLLSEHVDAIALLTKTLKRPSQHARTLSLPTDADAKKLKAVGYQHAGGRESIEAETSRLLRAWEEVISETETNRGSPSIATFVGRFERLSDGGCSGYSVDTIKMKWLALLRMHGFIESVQSSANSVSSDDGTDRAVSDPSGDNSVSVAQGNGSCSGSRSCSWFGMSSSARKCCFQASDLAEFDFVDLTREQFDAISRIKASHEKMGSIAASQLSSIETSTVETRTTAAKSETVLDAASIDKHNDRKYVWTENDTSKLIHAWEMTASKASLQRLTAVEVGERFKRSLDHPPSTVTILRKFRALSNTYEVILLHDKSVEMEIGKSCSRCGEPNSWFKMPPTQRQHCFGLASKAKSIQYLPLTSEHYAAICKIKRSEFGGTSENRSAGRNDDGGGDGGSHKRPSAVVKSTADVIVDNWSVEDVPIDDSECSRDESVQSPVTVDVAADGSSGVASTDDKGATDADIGGSVDSVEGVRSSKQTASHDLHQSMHVDSGSRLVMVLEKLRANVSVATERASTYSPEQNHLIDANEDHDASDTLVERTRAFRSSSSIDDTAHNSLQSSFPASGNDCDHGDVDAADIDDGSSTESEAGEDSAYDSEGEGDEGRMLARSPPRSPRTDGVDASGGTGHVVIDAARSSCDAVDAISSAEEDELAVSSSTFDRQSPEVMERSHSLGSSSFGHQFSPSHQKAVAPHQRQDEIQPSQLGLQQASTQSKRKRIESAAIADERSLDTPACLRNKQRRMRGRSSLLGLVVTLQAQTKVLKSTLRQAQQLIALQQANHEEIMRSVEQHQRECQAQREQGRLERQKKYEQERVERLELLEHLRHCQCSRRE